METNNTSSIFSADKMSTTDLPYPYLIVFLLLYTVTAALSIVGNVLVVVVLVARKRLTKGVRYCLVNLAVADFFMAGLCTPFMCIDQLYGQWFLSAALCNIIMFVENAMQVVSVLTLTVIGIDRYFAVLFPLKFGWLRSDRTITLGLVIIWLVAIANCVPVYFYTEKQTLYISGKEISWCNYVFPSMKAETGFVMSNFLITYPIPIVILVFSYTSIAWKLFHRTSPGNADVERDLHQRQNMIKVIKMLVLIVVVFVLCWSPLQILNMVVWANFGNATFSDTTQRILFVSFTWFAMTNCFANPFIYCFSNNEFLKDLKYICGKLRISNRNMKEKLNSRSSNDSNATVTSQLSLEVTKKK